MLLNYECKYVFVFASESLRHAAWIHAFDTPEDKNAERLTFSPHFRPFHPRFHFVQAAIMKMERTFLLHSSPEIVSRTQQVLLFASFTVVVQ